MRMKVYKIYGQDKLYAGTLKRQSFGNPARDDLYTYQSKAGDIIYDLGVKVSIKGIWIEGHIPGIGEIYHFIPGDRLEAQD